jgi:hypothetical protein
MSTTMSLMLLFVTHSALAQVPELAAAPDEAARFRGGVSLATGIFLAGATPELDLTAQAGVQLTRRWALLGEAGLTWGLPREAGTYLTYGHVGALAEATFADRYFIGAGPLVAFGLWSAPTSTDAASAAAGLFPGLDLRLGVGFGSRDESGRRHQFTVGLDAKLMIAGAAVSASSASAPATIGPGLGTSLILFLGYQAK